MNINDYLKINNYDLKTIKKKLNCSDFQLLNAIVKQLKETNLQDEKDDCLVIEKLSFASKKETLLKDVSFNLIPGSFHIFIGENGAGKSTTIKCIIGKNEDYIGSIHFNKSKTLQREKIFYVPDQQPKFPNMSVFNYLLEITKLLTDTDPELVKEKIKTYSKKYSFEKQLNKNVNRLSTGQKQKILLITSFLVNSKYIILDEPFANLDPTSRYLFMNELKEMTQNGTSIFLSTHFLEEIKDYVDHITYIKKGKILLSTKVEDKEFIVKYYLNEYVRSI